MTTIQFSAAAGTPTIRTGSFSVSTLETPANVSGSVSDVSWYDATFQQTTGAGFLNNCRYVVQDSPIAPGYSFTNNTPAIATIDAIGNVAYMSNGESSIDLVTPVGKRRLLRAMSASGGVAIAFKNYKTGSLGLHIQAQINAMIAAKTPGQTTKKLLSASNDTWNSLTATRNASLFTGALNLTAISVARSGQTNGQFPAVLISPRHVLTNRHTLSGIGSGFGWLDSNGAGQSATVTGVILDAATDMAVGYLSAAIPSTVLPMKILPTNWASYLRSLNQNTYGASQQLPCLIKSHWTEDAGYQQAINIGEIAQQYQAINTATGSEMVSAYETWNSGSTGIRGGDSASPILLPINGVATLVGSYYATDLAFNFAEYKTWIDAGMNSLATAAGDPAAGSYAVGTCDLSGFTAYTTI